ncbi:MAG TPA: PKD domain-containing protein, partial [Syntrophaceae bacterium]|nr:PKD domain-containing protein [Syntrophaceae bacterium]
FLNEAACSNCLSLDACSCYISSDDVIEYWKDLPLSQASDISNVRLALYFLNKTLDDEIEALESEDYNAYRAALQKEKIYADRLLFSLYKSVGDTDNRGHFWLVEGGGWTSGMNYIEMRRSMATLYTTFKNAWIFEYQFLNQGEIQDSLTSLRDVYWYPAANIEVGKYNINVTLHTIEHEKFSGKIRIKVWEKGWLWDKLIEDKYYSIQLGSSDSYTINLSVSSSGEIKVTIYAVDALVIDSDYTDKLKNSIIDYLWKTNVYDKYFKEVLLNSTDYIEVYLHSPARLHAIDEQGRHIGINNSGFLEVQMPEARYFGGEHESIVIFNTSNVTFYTTGIENGTFDLIIEKSSVREKEQLIFQDIETTSQTITTFNPVTNQLNIDTNGDGMAETSLIPPVANFTFSLSSPEIGQKISFNASSSYDPDGYITNYQWDFGDGNLTTTDQPIIEHTYSSAGNYTVTLTVTDDDGLSASISKQISVSEAPMPDGDINGDNKLDLKDAIYLAKHVVGLPGYKDLHADGDINCDGEKDLKDAIYLAKHVVGLPGYEELYLCGR